MHISLLWRMYHLSESSCCDGKGLKIKLGDLDSLRNEAVNLVQYKMPTVRLLCAMRESEGTDNKYEEGEIKRSRVRGD